jgi:hypothetical protein
MINRINPELFDQQIEDIIKSKELAQAKAKEAIELRKANELLIIAQSKSSITEEISTPIFNPVDHLLSTIRKTRRLDTKVVYTLLHKDIYESLTHAADCTDLSELSEICFTIYEKIKHVDGEDYALHKDTSHYYYEYHHGKYLGHDSWSVLAQSHIYHNRNNLTWVPIPLVQNNRYKYINSFKAHTQITSYMLSHKLVT